MPDECVSTEHLHIIPYAPGMAEYASQVRSEIVRRKRTDFQIAVDFPAGLEQEVLTAVKKLPQVSVIVDQLRRGIPIIPTSAPVEAVRSFLEYGLNLKFIDTSLPVTGNISEYQYFVDLCRRNGLGYVLTHAADLGVSPGDILKSLHSQEVGIETAPPFAHVSGIVPSAPTPDFDPATCSPYLETRLRSMAMKVRHLLADGNDLILICSFMHAKGILHYLNETDPPIDDSYVVPGRSFLIGASDIPYITREIPYFMYLYERFRNFPVNRERWIKDLYCSAEMKNIPANVVDGVMRYACRLALTDQDLFPGLYNIVASAKFIAGDDYAFEIYRRAMMYPPSADTESECQIKRVYDYNFGPLYEERVLSIKPTLFINPSYVDILRDNRKIRPGCWYSRWSRTPECYQAEREFMQYVTARFTARELSDEEYVVHEYTCGLGDGFDIRETIRQSHTGRIYIREAAPVNTAGYIFDYRKFHPAHPSEEKNQRSVVMCGSSYWDHIFMDRYYAWIGVTRCTGNHYTCGVMTAFGKLDLSPTRIFTHIDSSQPLTSSVDVALQHTKNLFVFTDSPEEVLVPADTTGHVKVYPCSIIPPSVYSLMSEFNIAGMRYDNRPGD